MRVMMPVAILAATAAPLSAAPQASSRRELAPILERAGRYVVEYEEKFQDIVADETYTQSTRRADTRPTVTAVAEPQARRLTQGSDQRYNIGPALRDINVPTLSLMFLHPKNQSRFAWKLAGKRRFGSVDSNLRRISTTTADQSPASPPVLSTSSVELADLLRRVGEYVAEYERSFSDLVAEETYAQRMTGLRYDERVRGWVTACTVCRRTTRADLVFVRLAGEIPWASYRDVFEVDGRPVREHEERLVKLLSNPSPDTQEQARKLLAASAAYNIGPVKRTVNLPTLPLLFLLPRNQERFAFRLGGRRMIGMTEVVELAFRETSRPTLVRGPWDSDLPAEGRFWVNAARAAVVRTEVEFAFGAEAEARVTTEYRPEPTLAMWVPAEMREHFADVPRAKVKTFPAPFNGVARYERFRRFTVSTDEKFAPPPP